MYKIILKLLTVLAIISFSKSFSQNGNNTIFDIAPHFSTKDAVILNYDFELTVLDENNAEYKVHKRILIKNENALKYCNVGIIETQFVKNISINAILIDLSGEIKEELDQDNIRIAEISPGYDYYSPEKYISFNLKKSTFPFIIEYTYNNKINSLFFWPDWYPQNKVPTLLATYKLKLVKPIKFKYYNVGIKTKPNKSIINGNTVYTWSLKNIPPLNLEDYIPPENKEQMVIHFVPQNFYLDKYYGSFESWSTIAKWYSNLTIGKYELSSKAKTEIKNLIKNVNSTKERINILYKYLQKKNRYVAIELGISGWQPQSATDVYQNRYGDCKDLTTFMISILKEAGIVGYPALTLTRNKGIVKKDFPSNQFNHCITFVPLKNDTLWLECTSSYTDVGEMPYLIEDVDVLVVKDDKGELIRTPRKISTQNKWKSNINAVLDIKGNLNFNLQIDLTGNQRGYYKSNLEERNPKEDKLFLQYHFGRYSSGLDIRSYLINDLYNSSKNYLLSMEGTYNKFSSLRGRRLFINPNIYNRETKKDIPDEEINKRKYPVFYNYPYLDIDTVVIKIPKGYLLESKPKNRTISNSFADFSSKYSFKDDILLYVRKYEIKKNLIPVKQYKEYLKFTKTVIKSDRSKFVFKKL